MLVSHFGDKVLAVLLHAMGNRRPDWQMDDDDDENYYNKDKSISNILFSLSLEDPDRLLALVRYIAENYDDVDLEAAVMAAAETTNIEAMAFLAVEMGAVAALEGALVRTCAAGTARAADWLFGWTENAFQAANPNPDDFLESACVGRALVAAAGQGGPEILEVLQNQGVDLDRQNGLALMTAISSKHYNSVAFLLELEEIDITRNDQQALRRAVELGQATSTVMILEHLDGDMLDDLLLDDVDDPPLLTAVRLGHESVVELLVRHYQANVHVQEGRALLEAVRGGHRGIARILLERGADTAALNYAPFLEAVRQGNREMVELLLWFGVDVNADDGHALQIASERGELEMMNYLMDNEADLYRFGEDAMTAAVRGGCVRALDLLLRRHAWMRQGTQPLMEALKRNRLQMLATLLDYRTDGFYSRKVMPIDFGDNKLLRTAILQRNKQAVRWLLERGANPYQSNIPVRPVDMLIAEWKDDAEMMSLVQA